MALYDGFFDAALNEETGEYDRTYNSGDFTGYFDKIIGSGVCVHGNDDSFKVRFEDGAAVISPGYLFIQGYWMRNDADYTIPLTGSATVAIAAHLNLGKRMIELEAQSAEQAYPDSLVLALVNPEAGSAEDTRYNTDICGVIDTAGALSAKAEWAINYIDNEIEGKLAAAAADIAAQSALLDEKVAEVTAQVDKIAPPAIGTIQFSASQDIGPEWLRCDGRFISETEYPELVAALGKLTPNAKDTAELGNGRYSGTFSTSFLYEGYLWVFWMSGSKLLGFPTGDGETEEISLEGDFSAFVISNDTPIILSICGGCVFLAQSQTTSRLTLLMGDFSLHHVVMSALDTNAAMEEDINVASNIPEVVETNEGFAVSVGIKTAVGMLYYFIFTKQGNFLLKKVYMDKTAAYIGVAQDTKRRFSRKCSGELFSLSIGMMASNTRFHVGSYSALNGTYSNEVKGAEYNSSTVPAHPILVSPIVNSEYYIYRCYIANRALYIDAGSMSPFTEYLAYQEQKLIGITPPVYAAVFPDSLVYVPSHRLYVIFIGTGIAFSQTPLDMNSWGYLDTQEYFGIITQAGCVEYDEASNSICLSGKNTQGNYVAGLIRLHDIYDYANDGAWLPVIASDGIPAYIKAKEAET